MNKDAFWFKHDSNAKDDPKCIILIEELGLEGYGIFWVLIETLRDQPDLEASLRILPAIARRYNTSHEKVKAVVFRYELFKVVDDKFFFSESLKSRMEPLMERREQDRINGIKGNLIKHGYAKKSQLDRMSDDEILCLNDNRASLSGGESGGGRYKRRKDKKREELKREESTYPFDDFWDDYDHKKDRKKSERKWKKISEKDRQKIKEFIPIYKAHQPDSQYRKYPTTFLNSEIWNDDWSAYPPKQEQNQSYNGHSGKPTKGDRHAEAIRSL